MVNEAISEVFSTPDTIYKGKGDTDSWTSNDAVPFFVLFDGTLIFGANGKRHMDYMGDMPYASLGKFSQKVALQGRYWKNDNSFSFWSVGEDDRRLMLDAVLDVCRRYGAEATEAAVYVYDNKMTVVYDERYDEFHLVDSDNTIYSNEDVHDKDDVEACISHWIESDSDFVDREYGIISVDEKGVTTVKDLGKLELLCTAVYQVYCDFLKSDSHHAFSIREFDKYLFKRYNMRFKQMMDYFHNNVRRLLVPKKKVSMDKHGEYLSEGNLEEIALKSGLNLSEYEIAHISDTKQVYSLTVKTTDYDKFKRCLDLAKSEGVVVDRVNKRSIGDDEFYHARLRNGM